MNYKKIYDSLIERGRTRVLNSYKEKHHIIPRCMDGTNDAFNLVDLTPEEHYVAHQLLMKINVGNHALAKAAAMMIPNRPSNKMYGWVRRRFSEAKSAEQTGSGNSQYGTRWKWISNVDLKENRKISLDIDIPSGWVPGLNVWTSIEKEFEKKKAALLKQQEMQNKIETDTALYREYYIIYTKVGYDEFVRKTGYRFSKENLVQRFSKLLPEFVPQNGKKR